MSTLSIHAFFAVCTVAAGHRMVTEGWTLFQRMCEEVGPGELPQLLRQLKSAMTPTPACPGPSTPVKIEPMEEEEEIEQLADVGVSGSRFTETPIMIKLGPHQYTYKCGNCDIPPKTKCAMDAHICSVHTRRPSCAPSVISAHTIWIHSRDMRRSTSSVFFVIGVML